MKVRDVMTRGAIGLPESASLVVGIETMLRARVSALLVFGKDGALAGILSEGDLMRRGELGTEQTRPRWLEFLLSGGRLSESYVRSHGRKVGEIMSADVVTIGEDADLGEAVDLMMRRGVKRLPVLREGQVIGIVARSDLLKGLLAAMPRPGQALENAATSDAEIRTTILAELDKLAWAPRATVHVAVERGVVSYTGAITDERMRSGLKVIAENVPGVLEVHDHLAWIEPNSGLYMPSPEDAPR